MTETIMQRFSYVFTIFAADKTNIRQQKNMNVNYFSSLSDNQPKEVVWETVATEIRSDKLKDICLRYRALLPEHAAAVASGDKDAQKAVKAKLTALKNQCSAFMPQVTLDGGRSTTSIRGYRPYMIVDIDHIPPEQFPKVERMVKDDEHSRLAYTTISGRGLRVIAQVDREVDETNFRDAWLSVNEYYKRLTGLDYDRQCSTNTRMSGLSWDPTAVYRPRAKTIKVEHKEAEKKQRRDKVAGRAKSTTTTPDAGSSQWWHQYLTRRW